MQQLELSASAAPVALVLPTIVTKSEYARHRNVSPAYVSKLIRLGKLTAPALRVDGKIDRYLADRQIEAQSDPARTMPEDEPEPEQEDEKPSSLLNATFAAEKSLHESLKRQRTEIDLAKAKGELVEREAVEREAEQVARELRNRLLEMPNDVAVKIAGETNEHTIILMLREAITKCLTQAAEDIETGRMTINTEDETSNNNAE